MDRVEFRTRRRVAGLTMARTAVLLGVTERTVWRWEHGVSRIDGLKAVAIRERLTIQAKKGQPDSLSYEGVN